MRIENICTSTTLSTDAKEKLSSIIGILITEFRQISQRYTEELPKGWRLRLYVAPANLKVELAEGDGGSFADAKLHTLLLQPHLPATGQSPRSIHDFLLSENHQLTVSQGVIDRLDTYIDDDTLPLAIERYLRDEIGITGLLGAFRVPTVINAPLDPHRESTNPGYIEYAEHPGEIITSFSGARSEQDVYFAAKALSIFATAYQQIIPQNVLQLDFTKLRANPAISFQLKQVDLIE